MGEHYTHLHIRERAMVEVASRWADSPAQIAVYLSRSRSTITREMARNGWRGRIIRGPQEDRGGRLPL